MTPDEAPISHSVFNFVAPAADQPPADDPPAEEGAEPTEQKKDEQPKDILETFQHVYIPEVVRE